MSLRLLLNRIAERISIIEEISASSKEQQDGATQINDAIMQLDQIIQYNASASEELASMSEELNGQAEQLQTTVAFFRIDGTGGVGGRRPRALAPPAVRTQQLSQKDRSAV